MNTERANDGRFLGALGFLGFLGFLGSSNPDLAINAVFASAAAMAVQSGKATERPSATSQSC